MVGHKSNRLNDTSFGINNEGSLVFDYYHEDTDQVGGANVYNGQLSTLWVNFRQAFPDKIQETYQDLRSNSVLNYDELVDQFITKGSDKWSESIYNEDGDFKYVSMLRSSNDATNLPQIRGTGEEHFRYFIENRLNYCDSKWYAGEYISRPNPNNSGENIDNFAVLRIYTPVDENGNPRTDLAVPASADITLTMYSHMYAGVRYKANGTLMQKRLSANETYTFDAPNEIFNDTETAIYGAPHLSSLGDLAPLYLGYIDVGAATKLVELKIGDSTPGYQNNNLYHLALGTNRLLKKIDIQNCIGFDQALDLTGCPNIEEVYAKGSGITGVDLPSSGYLKVLQLPATIANLTLKNQLYIEDLDLEGCGELKTITIENTPVDAIEIIDSSPKLERVRLTDVDWSFENTDKLYELYERGIGGINESGANTSTMWIDGKCHITALTGSEMADIKRMYPYLEITYDTLESQLIFMALENGVHDNWVEVHRQTILNGRNGTNPISTNSITTPIKNSTAQYHHTFNGWALTPNGAANEDALRKVEMDRTVYAAFTNEIRSYTVYFYNTDANSTLLYETIVEYGKDATYAGEVPIKDVDNPDWYEFYAWNPPPTNIKGETKCYAQYNDLREITDDWATITAACEDGTATDRYYIGAFKPMTIEYKGLPITMYQTSLIEYNDELHLIGNNYADNMSSRHFKWNETDGLSVVSAFNATWHNMSAVIYNNEIHALGGHTSTVCKFHCKWDGSSWVSVSTIPYPCTKGKAVVYNDEIHLIGSYNSEGRKSHYKWNETDGWASVSTLPFDVYQGGAVVYNDELHILGGALNPTKHYKWNGIEWTNVGTLPFSLSNGYCAVLDGEIHIMYNTSHYKWNDIDLEWVEVSTLPYPLKEGSMGVYKNQIHILGESNKTEYSKEHYKWTGTEWVMVCDYETIDMEVVGHNHDELIDGAHKWEYVGNNDVSIKPKSSAVVYNREIHFLSGLQHYKYDFSINDCVEVSTLPYYFISGTVVIYNDEIHIMGGNSSDVFTKHYKYDGTEWLEASTLPYNLSGQNRAVVLDDILYLASASTVTGSNTDRQQFWKWDGNEWTDLGGLSCNANTMSFLHNGRIYVQSNALSSEELGINKGTTVLAYYDNGEWIPELLAPANTTYGNITKYLSYNNEIHFFSTYGHYKWNGTEYVKASSLGDFYNCYNGEFIIYNNEIYSACAGNGANIQKIYKWSTTHLEADADLLVNTYVQPSAVEFKNNLYALYNAREVHVFDGDNWSKLTQLTTDVMPDHTGRLIVYNDELHMICNNVHSKFDEEASTFTIVDTVPVNASYGGGTCIYNGSIHVLGGYQLSKMHYRWNETDGWVALNNTPFNLVYYNNVVYDGAIHVMDGKNHYKWNESDDTWTLISTFDDGFGYGDNIVYNNEIYHFGSVNNKSTYYKFNGIEWAVAGDLNLNVNTIESSATIFRDKLHLLGNIDNIRRSHYVLRNPRASLTFLAKNLTLKGLEVMNTGKTTYGDLTEWNAGGWCTSYLRSYYNNKFLYYLPTELQESIKEVKKYTDDGQMYEILALNDKVWIPSFNEIDGESSGTKVVPLDSSEEPYDVFTDNESRIRKRIGIEVPNVNDDIYILRTRGYISSSSTSICHLIVNNTGNIFYASADCYSLYNLFFGFCI